MTRSDLQLKHRTASNMKDRLERVEPRRIRSLFQELTEHGKALRQPLLPKPVRPLRDFPLNYHSSSNFNHNSASSKPNPSFLVVLCYRTIQTGACLWYCEGPGKSMTLRKRMPTPHQGQLHIHHTVRGTILSPTSPLYLKSQLPIKEKPALL